MNKTITQELLEIVAESTNHTETAKAIKKKYNFTHSVDNLRKMVGIWSDIIHNREATEEDENGLVVVSRILDGDGEVKSTREGRPNPDVDTEGMVIDSVSKSPHTTWVKYKANKNPYKNMGEEFTNLLSDMLADKITSVEIPKIQSNNKSLLVCLSDRHIGASVESNSLYDNEYDPEKYSQRLMIALSEIINQADGQTYDELIIADLGDLLDGYEGLTTRGGHKLVQNLSSREQYDTFLKYEKVFWDKLVENKIANTYVFVACSNANHDGAFGYTAYRAIEEYLNIKYPQIETNVFDKFIDHIEVDNLDRPLIFSHGKDETYKRSGMPLNLDLKTESFISDYMRNKGISEGIFIKGDLHQESYNSSKTIEYINTPSMFGSSGYIQTNFGDGFAGFFMGEIKNNRLVKDWIRF